MSDQGEILRNKEEIMEYTGMRKSALKKAVDQAEFPIFYIGGKMQSSTVAINEWYYTMSMNRVNLDTGRKTNEDKN